jgi:voltage-gated sodium channel
MFSNPANAPAGGSRADQTNGKVHPTKREVSCPYPKVVPVYPPVETSMSNISGDSAVDDDQICAPYAEFKDNDCNSNASHVSFESQDTFTINGTEHHGNIWGNKASMCPSCICFDLKLAWPEQVVKARAFKRVSIALILLNCILAAIGTSDMVTTSRSLTRYSDLAKEVFVYIMSAELFLQFYVNGISFFANGWLVFDFVIIGLAWIMPNLLVMRTFRVVRTLRLATWVKDLKQLVIALLLVIPKMFAIFFLLLILFVIFSILFTDLFKHAYDDGITQEDYFSRIDITLFTLFQIMTLDGWAAICKDIMEDQPWAWVPFVSFVVVSSFFFLNLVIAVVCDAVTSVHQDTVVKYIRDDISAATSAREALKVDDRLDELAGSIQLIMKAQITILEGLQLQQQQMNAQNPISSADSTASQAHEENLRRTTQLLQLELQSAFFGTKDDDSLSCERTPVVANRGQADFTMCDRIPEPMSSQDEDAVPPGLQFWQDLGLSDDQISRVMARLGASVSRNNSQEIRPSSMLQGLQPPTSSEPTLPERARDAPIDGTKKITRSTTPEPDGFSRGCWG